MSGFTTDSTNPSTLDISSKAAELQARLQAESEKGQIQAIQDVTNTGEISLDVLMALLLERQSAFTSTSTKTINIVNGSIYQTLFAAKTPKTEEFLQTHFPTGTVKLHSERGIDYRSLQRLLAEQNFEAADRMTLQKLCELAGPTAVQRKWLYFTEVEGFPAADLQTIDALWLIHSQGKFGFSVQRELWLSSGKNWDKFWTKIGWKTGNNWTRYPQEFTWDLVAPIGHLPLSNQLRGVRVIASLLTHPAWTNTIASN